MKRFYAFTASTLLLGSLSLVGSPSSNAATQANNGGQDRFQILANSAMEHNRPTAESAKQLQDELLFQRATQAFLWAMPLINTMGMYDGFKDVYGGDYNQMAIWEKRLDAKTHITTPNSDLIYGISWANLAETGPLVLDAPAKLQGILLDMWQRPIPVDGGKFFGDLGLPGPDEGKGGKFLLLPPGYDGEVPKDHYVYRSATNNVFIFLRSFYQSLDNIQPAVDILKQTKIYPLNGQASAKPMTFHYASGKRHDMLPRSNIEAFKQLKWLVDAEGNNLADADGLGILAGVGIVQNQAFEPNAREREILNNAATTAYKMSRVIGMQDQINDVNLRVYEDRQWLNPINNLSSRYPDAHVDLSWTDAKHGFRNVDARTWMFTDYYSISPGMVSMTPGKGAFYMIAFKDGDGEWLNGENNYSVRLPKDIPAALFWSVTLYEAENASGLDNGQPFPSLGKLNKPAQEADGSIILHLGPKAPAGKEGNWLATVPNKGYFAILRLYAPTEPAISLTWKPGDFERIK